MKSLVAALACLVLVAFAPSSSAEAPNPLLDDGCVVVMDQPDNGLWYCVDRSDPNCTVYEKRTTFLGTEKHCISPTSSCDPCGPPTAAVAVALPDVQCMDVYSRTNVGTVSIVRRNSCAAPEVYQCPYEGAPISQCHDFLETAFTTSASEPMCMYYYSEQQVGPVRIVQRDSCTQERYICGEDAAAYLLGKPDPNGFVQCTWESTGLVGPVLW